jgi:signal transduction histidine kinase
MLTPNRPTSLTLRGRLVLWTAAITLPTALLAAWLIREALQDQRDLLHQQLTETSRALGLVVDRQIGQSESLLRGVATSPHLKSRDYQALYAQCKELSGPDHWFIVREIEGNQVINTYLPFGQTAVGTVPAPLEFAPALARGEVHVSNLVPSQVQPKPVLCVVYPVTIGGQLTHVLTEVMLPDRFTGILREQRFPSDWVAAIVDREGTVIARSRAADQFVGRKTTGVVQQAIARKQSDVFRSVTLDGIESVTAVMPTPRYGWTVVVAAPRAMLYAPARRMVVTASVVSIALLAAGVLVAALSARRILRAVEGLSESARRMGQGEQPAWTRCGIPEADQIASALQDSASALQARELDLKRLNESLENRVRERTRELDQANRALSIRNRELEDFAHIISHDIQAPVQRMGKFADLLESDVGENLGENGRFYVNRLKASAVRMTQLLRDILAFSSITLEPRVHTRVQLGQVLTAAMSDLELRISQSGARIEAGELHAVHGDAAQVYHVLLNLLSNALKFHRPGVSPVVRVQSRLEGKTVHLVVEDNGIGFDARHTERLFTPFQRLHRPEAYEGSGIGLAIVRRIVERHGGSVSAQSKPDHGSRFEVTFPAAEPLPAEPRNELANTTVV